MNINDRIYWQSDAGNIPAEATEEKNNEWVCNRSLPQDAVKSHHIITFNSVIEDLENKGVNK